MPFDLKGFFFFLLSHVGCLLTASERRPVSALLLLSISSLSYSIPLASSQSCISLLILSKRVVWCARHGSNTLIDVPLCVPGREVLPVWEAAGVTVQVALLLKCKTNCFRIQWGNLFMRLTLSLMRSEGRCCKKKKQSNFTYTSLCLCMNWCSVW